MIKYLIKRIWQLAIVLVAVSILVFIMTSLVGDPLSLLVKENASAEQIAEATEYLGLDKPAYYQYFLFVKNALKGDFGVSYRYHQSAIGLIIERMPATLELVTIAMLLSIVFGIVFGVYAGAYPNSFMSKTIMNFSIAGISVPSFWLGMLMIYVFAIKFGVLPVSGKGQVGTIFGIKTSLATIDGLKHVILPALTLSMGSIASIIRLTRAGIQENMVQDYVKLARAKGVKNKKILFGHVLKNTLIPIITIFGLQLGTLIAFTTITETIFAWPGMGKLIIDSINSSDTPIISAYILLVAVIFVVINFVVDLLYCAIDPRIELK